MAVQVSLAANGVTGVTGLTSAQITSANDGQNLAINTALIATGTTSFTVNLPLPGIGEDFEGSVIIIKTQLPTRDTSVTPPTGNTLTIGRETVGANQVRIDGTNADYVLDTRNQVVSFYYINEAIGWMAGPAIL